MFHVKQRSLQTIPDLSADRARALTLTPVSRETLERLDRFVELLLTWQQTINLIAASTIPQLWTRHIADSLQLIDLAPDARTWIDLGIWRGLSRARHCLCHCRRRRRSVHLVESNAKKAAFLREAARSDRRAGNRPRQRDRNLCQRPSTGRSMSSPLARCRPLNALLDMSFPLLAKNGATGLFPKGQDADAEFDEASQILEDGGRSGRRSRTDPGCSHRGRSGIWSAGEVTSLKLQQIRAPRSRTYGR